MADATGRGRAAEARDRKRDAGMVAVGIAAVLLIWFALANLQDTEIHFWVTSTRAPLIVVIVIAGLMGALIGAMVRRRRTKGAGGAED